ncbi:hypothetical protein E2C01_099690 [Portunus trituberculatus]|uniref:Uncharacterized protein n=1 Tax=Portunus trituberculatus TaxID=210409 RepID=A0A5B7K0Y5_PORTR|nr:hypothetical protein [Portunus trituberculatus]
MAVIAPSPGPARSCRGEVDGGGEVSPASEAATTTIVAGYLTFLAGKPLQYSWDLKTPLG